MKKTLSIIALGMILLSSCSKDYTCECTTNGEITPTVTTETIKASKKKATSDCEAKNTANAGIIKICKIK